MPDIPSLLLHGVEKSTFAGWALLATCVLALIKAWPALQLQADNAKAVLRGERRDDLHDCQEQLNEFRSEFDTYKSTTTEQIHQLDLKLVGTMTAYRILHAEVTEHRPDSSALLQARAIMNTSWNGPVNTLGVVFVEPAPTSQVQK